MTKHVICRGIIVAALVILVLVSPVSAVLQVTEYRGTVTALNATAGTMTIKAVATYGCDYTNTTPVCSWSAINATNVTGTVPDNQVLSEFKSGDSVAASILGGPGGDWAAVALIFPTPGIENWYSTDVHGDPVYVENVPLAASYAVATLTAPDCTKCTGTVCVAKSAMVEIQSSGTVVKNVTLTPGQNVTYNGRNDGSSVQVTFLSGEAPSSACPNATGMMTGPQPVSDFTIHVQQPVATPTTTKATTPPTSPPTTVPPTTTTTPGMTAITAIAAMGLFAVIFARNLKK